MQITLCEDDGIFHGGIPSLVVLQIKFDDGKIKRIPYPADKSIAALYEDLNAIAPKVSEAPQEDVFTFPSKDMCDFVTKGEIKNNPDMTRVELRASDIPKVQEDRSRIIEKEDFVRIIRIDENRDKEHSFLLTLGQEVRVIKVISTMLTMPGQDNITKIVQGYDVVDDNAGRPERTRLFPHEVELSRKRTTPIIKKESKIEEIRPCPDCQVPNSLVLEGSDFKGVCVACQNDICIARIIRKCQTDKCQKEGVSVSCFDVGGKFQGTCNSCGSSVEVPYV